MKREAIFGIGVSALALGMADCALAQGAAEPVTPAVAETGGAIIEDIVVTARRREEKLQDVPISVIAVQGETLSKRGVETLADVMKIAPGVNMEASNGRPSTLQVTIRGQRMYGLAPTQDSPTAVYFADALIQPTTGFNQALHDIENVQVLKGPQGTLFGRNTTGGSLTVSPNKPSDRNEGAMTGTLGNLGVWGLKGFINVAAMEGFKLRIAAYHQERGPYQNVLTAGHTDIDAGDDQATDIRVSTIIEPTDNISNYFVGYWGKTNTGVPIPRAYAINPTTRAALFGVTAPYNTYPNLKTELWRPGDDFTDVYTRFRQFDKVKVWGGVNNLQIDLGGVTIKNIASYRDVESDAFLDVGGVDVPYIDTPNGNSSQFFSEELQLQGTAFDDRLTYTGGLYYARTWSDDFSAGSTYNITNSATVLTPTVTYYVNKAKAAYFQGTYKFTDKLSFTGGIRFTEDTRFVSWRHRYFDNPGLASLGIPTTAPFCAILDDAGVRLPITACRIDVRKKFSEPTWNLSLDYKVSPGTLVYVTQRRGYRTGGYNFRATTLATRIPFEPETVMDYEVGVKTDFHVGSWGVRLNVDGYYDEYKNLQKTVGAIIPQTGQVATSIFNAAKGNVRGLEAELTVRPTSTLTFGGNWSYLKSKYTSFPFFVSGASRDFSDRKLAGVPTNQVSAFADFRLPLDNDRGALSLSASYTYFGSTYISEVYQSNAQIAVLYTPAQNALFTPDIPYKTPSYQLVNLQAGWDNIMGKDFDLSFYVRNIFNEAAVTFTSPQFEGGGIAAVGFGLPRTYGLQLTARFGAR